MKKILLFFFGAAILIYAGLMVIGAFTFLKKAPDDVFGNSGPGTSSVNPAQYTIQWSDDEGIKSITVTEGNLYSITNIPSRVGYRFTGLWSQKRGGTQYIDENGSSVSAFTDKENIVLYPQFEPLRYTLVLHYGDANPNGNPASLSVDYGEEIPVLPTNLRYDHMEFVGWYTKPDRGGEVVTNAYGVVPEKAYLRADAYDVSDPECRIHLYAGFRGELQTLTLWLDVERNISEQVQVEWGTSIAAVRTETRIDGKGVLSWSRVPNDTEQKQLFTGVIQSDMTLYAAELAPVIDFDSMGGSQVTSVIAKAGKYVSLPAPTRENYRFAYWKDAEGNAIKDFSYRMPSAGATLYAYWIPVLTFSSNGGSHVDDLCAEYGSYIVLPKPERIGYEFAGWYTKDRQPFTATRMPEVGMELQAGWYQAEIDRLDLVTNGTTICINTSTTPSENSDLSTRIDLSAYRGQHIALVVHYQARWKEAQSSGKAQIGAFLYEGTKISASALLLEDLHTHTSTTYSSYELAIEIEEAGDTYLLCWVDRNGQNYSYVASVWAEICYLDTSEVLFS